MNLVIVESPGKLKTIRKILGSGWQVEASVGHVRDLPDKEIGVEPPDFKPRYVPTERGRSVIAKLKKAVANASTVYLATDLDREGEAIAWHLKQSLRLNDPKRISFSEITETAIKGAIQKPGDIDIKRVASQEGRRVIDRLVGYMVSPKLADLAGRRGLSAGRVQSPAVRIVVDREREIETFTVTNHFGVLMLFGDWTAEWQTKAFLAEGEKYILNQALADEVSEIRTFRVTEFDEKEVSKAPPAPFITSTLQQAASNKLGLKPKATMEAAQKLYEQGRITYMRTDSTTLSADALADIEAVCRSKGLPMVATPRTWPAKGDAQEAHEAIRPTSFEVEDAGETEQQRDLYRLIWLRALGSQLESARFSVRTACLQAESAIEGRPVDFKAKGQALVYKGWKELYDDDTESEQEREKGKEGLNNPVPKLETGQDLVAEGGKVLRKKTKPPTRFTEAELIKVLEKKGIGRPSTYASIMTNITGRSYIEYDKAGKYLIPTETGALVVDALVESGFSFVNYDFTRDMEGRLDLVAEGKAAFKEVVSVVHQSLVDEISKMKVRSAPQFECPKCGRALNLIPGRAGKFWGCTGYREGHCKATYPDKGGRPDTTPKEKPKPSRLHKCMECNSGLIRRKSTGGNKSKKGRSGKGTSYFWGCSGFPECRTTYPDVDGKPNYERSKETK